MCDYLCKTCRWWTPAGEGRYTVGEEYIHPTDLETYKPMKFSFEVRFCEHPKLVFCERPQEANTFGICDGSNYAARLYTAENFGCVLHEKSEAITP